MTQELQKKGKSTQASEQPLERPPDHEPSEGQSSVYQPSEDQTSNDHPSDLPSNVPPPKATNTGKKATKKFVAPPARLHIPKIDLEQFKICSAMYFDVETTGLETDGRREIIQMSAICDGIKFDCYVQPQFGIPPKPREITGITFRRGQMYLKQQPVPSKTLSECLEDFLGYVMELKRPFYLVAHNGFFDLGFLSNALRTTGLTDTFDGLCSGFVDTLPLARAHIPQSKEHNMKFLVQYYFGEVTADLHSSAMDILALEAIVQCMTDGIEDLWPFSFTLPEFRARKQALERAKGKLYCKKSVDYGTNVFALQNYIQLFALNFISIK